MRNIWGWVVGVLVVVGAGITIGRFFADGPGQRSRPPAPVATAPAGGETKPAGIPKPLASFKDLKIAPEDFSMGSASAPVTVVEYASLTCPHCAAFHNKVLPTVKSEFIDKGKVRLIYRDFPLDRVALTGSMLARCAGRERYFGFIEAFFASQDNWARDNDPVAALRRIARLGGMSDGDADACLKRQDVAEAVLKQRLEGEQAFGVNATPTLIIAGDKYSGALTIEQFRAIVAAKLGKS